MIKNILITGAPRSGKSTLMIDIIDSFASKTGFITKEIRTDNLRIGFEIITSKNEHSIFADITTVSEHKVGRYFVNTDNLEKAISSLQIFDNSDLLYIDEIGQMELLSTSFKDFARSYLHAPNICIAIISAIYENDFIEEVKQRDDVLLITITEQNRDSQKIFISKLLSKIAKAQRYIAAPDRFTRTSNGYVLTSEHGQRTLIYKDQTWHCNCEFFQEYAICSHCIAVKEYLETH